MNFVLYANIVPEANRKIRVSSKVSTTSPLLGHNEKWFDSIYTRKFKINPVHGSKVPPTRASAKCTFITWSRTPRLWPEWTKRESAVRTIRHQKACFKVNWTLPGTGWDDYNFIFFVVSSCLTRTWICTVRSKSVEVRCIVIMTTLWGLNEIVIVANGIRRRCKWHPSG